jgi:hypothetical protein
MRIRDLANRLKKLESLLSPSEVKLTFADGSTRVVAIKDKLGCAIAAWKKISWCIGPGEGIDASDFWTGPAPTSRFDAILDLLGRAVEIEPDNPPFLQILLNSAVEARSLLNAVGTENLEERIRKLEVQSDAI